MISDFRDVLAELVAAQARFLVVGGVRVPIIGLQSFIANKRASGRKKDLADLESLGAG